MIDGALCETDITVQISSKSMDKALDGRRLLATATVTLFESIEIHGWRIMKTDKFDEKLGENIWIQAPSYNFGGNWKQLVYLKNKDDYDLLQQTIYNTYKKLLFEQIIRRDEEAERKARAKAES